MSNFKELYPELPLVCLSPFFHTRGRRPAAPYRVEDTAMCRACAILFISQSTPQAPTHIRGIFPPPKPVSIPPTPPKLPGMCRGEHDKIVRAEAILDSRLLCWNCIDATLRLGATHQIKPLPTKPGKTPA